MLTLVDQTPLLGLLRSTFETGGTKRRSLERNQGERRQAAHSSMLVARVRWEQADELLDADGLPLSPTERHQFETEFLNLFEQVMTSPPDTLSERTLLNWHARISGERTSPEFIGYRTSDTIFGDRCGSAATGLAGDVQALLKAVWAEVKEIDAALSSAWAATAGRGENVSMLPEIMTLSVRLHGGLYTMNPFWRHSSLVAHLAGAWVMARYSWPAPVFVDVEAYRQASKSLLLEGKQEGLLLLTARNLPG
jgi:hypothetical protein